MYLTGLVFGRFFGRSARSGLRYSLNEKMGPLSDFRSSLIGFWYTVSEKMGPLFGIWSSLNGIWYSVNEKMSPLFGIWSSLNGFWCTRNGFFSGLNGFLWSISRGCSIRRDRLDSVFLFSLSSWAFRRILRELPGNLSPSR